MIPSRLESVSKVDNIPDIPIIFSTLETYLQRQWGHLWFVIPGILLLVFIISLRSNSIRNINTTLILLWILVAPVFAAISSGTTWQRVAFSWFLLPPLTYALIDETRTLRFKKALGFTILASCLVSLYIAFYNFASHQLRLAIYSFRSSLNFLILTRKIRSL